MLLCFEHLINSFIMKWCNIGHITDAIEEFTGTKRYFSVVYIGREAKVQVLNSKIQQFIAMNIGIDYYHSAFQ